MENPIKTNPSDHIPRTPEEAQKLFKQMNQQQKSDLLEKTLSRNEKIEQAAAVMDMMKHPGWPIFAAAIQDLREMVSGEATIANMTGSIFEKGAKVENLQGRMVMLESIQTLVDEFKKQARETPVDTAELKNFLDQTNNQ